MTVYDVPVHAFTAPPTQKSHITHNHHSDKLPLLSNMQAVAMVTVDTDQEKLKVQQFNGNKASKVQRSNPEQPVKRSQSLFAMRCAYACMYV